MAGERVCPVDPLRVPPAAASMEQIEGSDAGALFLARLPMNLSTGPLSPDEVAAVGTICRSLDGIPLGLELAAARSRTLSLPELAGRIDRPIKELAPSRHGVTPRHRTMRAALDWGYELLTPAAQAALRAMSVFAGGCELSAFAAVCHDDQHPRPSTCSTSSCAPRSSPSTSPESGPATGCSNPFVNTLESSSTTAATPPIGTGATSTTTWAKRRA